MNGKINVGSNEKVTIDGEKVKEKINLETFKGDNPLMLGSAGYTFPAKTLLKDGLQIINGVNGEDLTDTVANQTVAVEDLLRMVNRKIAMNNGEGQYVWKKLTAEDGDFVDFVVSADTDAYPNGGTQDGYWYKLVSEAEVFYNMGFSNVCIDKFTFSSRTVSTTTVTHSLGEVPKIALIMVSDMSVLTTDSDLGFATLFDLLKPGDTATRRNGLVWIELRKGSSYDYLFADSYSVSGSSASVLLTEETVKFKSDLYYTAGVEYTLITMA